MAFRGQYEHSLDAKDRLTVPSAFRDQLIGDVVLVRPPDPCLWLMTKDRFEAIGEQYITPHSPLANNARRIRRMLNANAAEGELDSAGRIRVPRNLVEMAGLDGSCAVIGAGEYVEIWNPAAWEKESELLNADFAEIAESFAGLGESG